MNDASPFYGRFTAEPDTTPPDADDYLIFSEDDIKVARFLRRDDVAVERKLRLGAIDAAIEHLEAARRLMGDGRQGVM